MNAFTVIFLPFCKRKKGHKHTDTYTLIKGDLKKKELVEKVDI